MSFVIAGSCNLLTIEDIRSAAERIGEWLDPTPTIECPALNTISGRRVLLKLEALNVTGSFKIRGALNALLQLNEEERRNGVVAVSSGNHGQAVAQAAAWLGIEATIVMPEDAPAVKRQRTEAIAHRVVPYDRRREDREAIGQALVEETGGRLIHPFDQFPVMAGQGTAGLELCQAAVERNVPLDLVAVPCSGGGLAAGVATAVLDRFPRSQVFVVEPTGYDDTARSLESAHRVANESMPESLCDALQVPIPGARTFPINQPLLAGGVRVSDDDVLRAMAFAAKETKVVLEPSGAAALAALLTDKLPGEAGVVGLVLSGGNVDPPVLKRALSTHL